MRSLPASDLLCKLRRQGAGDQGYSNNYRPFSAYPKLGIKSDFPHPEEVLIHQGLDGRWTPCHLRQIFARSLHGCLCPGGPSSLLILNEWRFLHDSVYDSAYPAEWVSEAAMLSISFPALVCGSPAELHVRPRSSAPFRFTPLSAFGPGYQAQLCDLDKCSLKSCFSPFMLFNSNLVKMQ